MAECPVCDGTGLLLTDICPLCDGVVPPSDDDCCEDAHGGSEKSEDDNDALFTVNEDGAELSLPSVASNHFFSAEFTVSGFSPPDFDARLTLGDTGSIDVCGLDFTTALRIAGSIASVPPSFLTPDLPPIATVLHVLGVAQCHRARIEVGPSEAGPTTAAEAVCLFYDALCATLASPEAFAALLRTDEVLPGIYRVHAQSRMVIASTFSRLQEFYESPYPSIRGQPFSTADFRRACLSQGTAFDFYLKWNGFNLPSRIVEAVRGGAIGPLQVREQALLASIDAARGGREGAYYVIGTCEGADALEHEMAHGLYALNGDYRGRVQRLLDVVDESKKEAMREKLLGFGYCSDEEILLDEMQAYMAGGNVLVDGCEEIQAEIRGVFCVFAGLHSTPYSPGW